MIFLKVIKRTCLNNSIIIRLNVAHLNIPEDRVVVVVGVVAH